jgi:hypothetical protein
MICFNWADAKSDVEARHLTYTRAFLGIQPFCFREKSCKSIELV